MCPGEGCYNRTIEIWIGLCPETGYNVQHCNTIKNKQSQFSYLWISHRHIFKVIIFKQNQTGVKFKLDTPTKMHLASKSHITCFLESHYIKWIGGNPLKTILQSSPPPKNIVRTPMKSYFRRTAARSQKSKYRIDTKIMNSTLLVPRYDQIHIKYENYVISILFCFTVSQQFRSQWCDSVIHHN